MVPDYGTQYEENPSSHYGGIHEDELMDWTTLSLCHTNFKCRCLLILLPKQQVSSFLDTAFFLLEPERSRVVKNPMVNV